MKLMVANGEFIKCGGKYSDVKLELQGHLLATNFVSYFVRLLRFQEDF